MSTIDGSDVGQNFVHELLLLVFVWSVNGVTVGGNMSFHPEVRCGCVTEDGARGVAVPNTDDQTERSSLGVGRDGSAMVDMKANGFCT